MVAKHTIAEHLSEIKSPELVKAAQAANPQAFTPEMETKMRELLGQSVDELQHGTGRSR